MLFQFLKKSNFIIEIIDGKISEKEPDYGVQNW